jgi:hydroxyethylthiazole kinase-like uncharacterized protein yjeF
VTVHDPVDLRPLDTQALRGWPLPALPEEADKEARGRVVVIGGSREIPGAAVLAGTAALRAGAGKLLIATAASVAVPMALQMPEARVIGLPETAKGGFHLDGVALLAESLRSGISVVIGPGMMEEEATCRFVAALLPKLTDCQVLMDAGAMDVITTQHRFEVPVLLTPHAGEMAHLTGESKERIQSEPQEIARAAARRWNAVVALKGKVTWIATPEGTLWRHEGGTSGLGTSGSGDTLAGVIGGMAARGASLAQAAAWGVVLHAQAGARLSERMGPVGFLARELPQEMLAVLASLET